MFRVFCLTALSVKCNRVHVANRSTTVFPEIDALATSKLYFTTCMHCLTTTVEKHY